MGKTFAIVTILVLSAACNRKPAESTLGSTDTVQSMPTSTSGTTATETGGGPPIKTDTSATGNAAGSGSSDTTGTVPGGTSTTATTVTTRTTATTATHT